LQYKFAKEQLDYSDFTSGRVFYSLPGYPAFPVRLASEIFQRCLEYREALYGIATPCTLYDPCCGTAYHLSVLGYLHGEHLRKLIASDVAEKAVAWARRNLGLLSLEGLNKRTEEISRMLAAYGKDSHKEALSSAAVLKKQLLSLTQKHTIETRTFQANATDSKKILENIAPRSVDIVFSDVPYGQHSHWQGSNPNELSNPLGSTLDALLGILSSSSIIAIVSDKQQKALHPKYQRIEQFQIGKRKVAILKPI
jgi:16S rRNA G966 N2-methylase RsmD